MMKSLFVCFVASLSLSAAQPGTPGGYSSRDVNDPEIIEIAHRAVKGVTAARNGMYALRMTKLNSARAQVVSGMNYVFDLEMSETDCRNNGADARNCPVRSNGKVEHCEITFYVQSWSNTEEVSAMNCRQVKQLSSFYQDGRYNSAPIWNTMSVLPLCFMRYILF